ncbi:hypothetical protein Poly51_38360 [Rubripirellula tenax]|uniref:Uncharacterized protein n=1 Tax=Rubripirellula tenax TaxID=2528015 RepID=A0A5C6EQ96_9BACT|nr:hypothetical protein [Rubripirellula tenax]TWU50544.1 hypothetical protein Poly51_38360 [Rubripirellula tenax]
MPTKNANNAAAPRMITILDDKSAPAKTDATANVVTVPSIATQTKSAR